MICPLSHYAINHPDHPFLIYPDRTITYSAVDLVVNACSKLLQDHPTEIPLAIVGSDALQTIAWLIAAARTGHIIAITSTKDPPPIRDQYLHHLGINSSTQYWPFPEMQDHSSVLTEIVDPHHPVCILFTSGSSGSPKAVVHSFHSLCAAARFSQQNIPFTHGDRWLLSLSLWHIGGLMIPLRAIHGGGSVVIKDRQLGEHVAEDQITHLSVVSTQLNDLLQADQSLPISSLKAVLVGGGAIPPSLVDRAIARHIPVHTTYGMTELGSQLCTTPPRSPVEVLRSAGQPLGDWQVIIDDHGEICVQGSPLFKGYWMGDHIRDPRDPNGYFHTGDTGVIRDGLLYPTGRVDQMFISGGENIHPEEIERILMTLCRTVIVVAVPNDRYGHRPIAFVDHPNLSEELLLDLDLLLHDTLPKFKHPDHLLPWPSEIPTHKPPRVALQKIATSWIIAQRSP